MNPHQSAVLEFQTKVAGQPIPDPFLPQRVMPDFFAKQKDIALEEWKEFKGHYDDLRRGSDDDGWRKDIADDLADTMFTVYGMANVVGEALFIIPISRDYTKVQFLRHEIDRLNELFDWKFPVQAVSGVCVEMIDRLAFIGSELYIDTNVALREVCDCNMTKLWDAGELIGREHEVSSGEWHVAPVQIASGQILYRVVNTHGKLIKSIHTRQPDHAKALLNKMPKQ